MAGATHNMQNGALPASSHQDNGDLEKQDHEHSNDASTPDKQQGKSDADGQIPRHTLPFGAWLSEHVTWSWFTCTQSTGGLAILMGNCPKQFAGLKTIGTVFFIMSLVLFVIFTTLMALRWMHEPERIRKSFLTPPECFFFGSWWLTIATIIINMQLFGTPHTGPWLPVAIRVCFWIYAACTISVAGLLYIIYTKYVPIDAVAMPPGVLFLVYSAMLTGTVAGSIASSQPPAQRLPIMVAGVAYQGFGWTVALLFIIWLIGGSLEKGLGPVKGRPGYFITIGPGGFTTVALIGISRATPSGYGYFEAHPLAEEVLKIVATWIGVFIWLISFWLFVVAVLSTFWDFASKDKGKWKINLEYSNVWWSFIFPNTGWTLATMYLGEDFESQGIQWVSVAMLILLVAVWLINLAMMAKNIVVSLLYDARVKLD